LWPNKELGPPGGLRSHGAGNRFCAACTRRDGVRPQERHVCKAQATHTPKHVRLLLQIIQQHQGRLCGRGAAVALPVSSAAQDSFQKNPFLFFVQRV